MCGSGVHSIRQITDYVGGQKNSLSSLCPSYNKQSQLSVDPLSLLALKHTSCQDSSNAVVNHTVYCLNSALSNSVVTLLLTSFTTVNPSPIPHPHEKTHFAGRKRLARSRPNSADLRLVRHPKISSELQGLPIARVTSRLTFVSRCLINCFPIVSALGIVCKILFLSSFGTS